MKPMIFVFLAVSASMALGATKYRHMAYFHHSTGQCLWDRSVYSALKPPTTILKEIHKYNVRKGFVGSDTVKAVESWSPSDDGSNNWFRWNNIFTGRDSLSLTSEILTDMIVNIKTCFIQQEFLLTDDSVTVCKTYIRNIVGVMAQHPDHFFILWDDYPCSAGLAGSEAPVALRSLKLCRWMKDTLANGLDAYGPFPHNIYLFDVFRIIANSSTGHCDSVYGSYDEAPVGNHPSNAAVAAIDSLFVTQAFDAAIAYEQNPMAVTWAGPTIPARFELLQNYPNPFNPSTIIRYALPARSHVTLSIFNTLGEQVNTLVNESQDAGYHEVRFDGSGLASGVYFYQLRARDFMETKRLVLVR